MYLFCMILSREKKQHYLSKCLLNRFYVHVVKEMWFIDPFICFKVIVYH